MLLSIVQVGLNSCRSWHGSTSIPKKWCCGCIGPYHRVNILQETNEGWRDMFATNLDPFFFLAKLVSPGMQQRKFGRIIAFSMANADQLVAQPQLTSHYIA